MSTSHKYYVKYKALFKTWKYGKRRESIIISYSIDTYVKQIKLLVWDSFASRSFHLSNIWVSLHCFFYRNLSWGCIDINFADAFNLALSWSDRLWDMSCPQPAVCSLSYLKELNDLEYWQRPMNHWCLVFQVIFIVYMINCVQFFIMLIRLTHMLWEFFCDIFLSFLKMFICVNALIHSKLSGWGHPCI